MRLLALIIFFLTCLASFQCQAAEKIQPSFDCKLAKTSLDNLICSNKEIQELDGYMSFYFQKLLKADPNNKNRYLVEQRNWLKSRKTICAIPDKSSNGIHMRDTDNCLKDLYRVRNRQLFNELYNPNGVTFIRIENEIDFFPFKISGGISNQELDQLYFTNQYPTFGEETQKHPEEGHTPYELFNCQDNDKISVGAESTPAVARLNSIQSRCLTLEWLKRAKKPNLGLLDGITISNIHYLPLDILPGITADDEARVEGYKKQNLTLPDLLRKDIIKVEPSSPNTLDLTYYDEEWDKKSEDGKHDEALAMSLYIKEVARGDFKGDGHDSILAKVTEYGTGTWSTTYMAIFTMGSNGFLVMSKIAS